jgi:hypothetical protein
MLREMGDHRRTGWYWVGGVIMGVGGAIFAGWYVAGVTGATKAAVLSTPTYVAIAFFVIGAGIVTATMRGFLPMAKRKKKGGNYTPPKSKPPTSKVDPAPVPGRSEPNLGGTGVRMMNSPWGDVEVNYFGEGTAIDADNAPYLKAKANVVRPAVVADASTSGISISAPQGDVGRTPEELWAMFEGLTNLQAQAVIKPFMGKPMTLSVVVDSVGVWNDKFPGVMEPYGVVHFSDFPKHIALFFKGQKWHDRLAMLSKGDRITVRGAIEEITDNGLVLENCELIS